MIYLNTFKSVYLITYMVGDVTQLQTQRVDYKEAKAYAKALGKKHKVKVKDNVKASTSSE